MSTPADNTPPSKRYGIAAERFAEFAWLMSEAGITWRFPERPRYARVMVDVDVEVGTIIALGCCTLYFGDDVIRVAEVP